MLGFVLGVIVTLLVVTGAGAAVSGVKTFRQRLAARARLRPVIGTVVRVDVSTDTRGEWYRPIIDYTRPDGATATFSADVAFRDSRVGQRVEVLMDPEGQVGPLMDTAVLSGPLTQVVVGVVIGVVAAGVGWWYFTQLE